MVVVIILNEKIFLRRKQARVHVRGSYRGGKTWDIPPKLFPPPPPPPPRIFTTKFQHYSRMFCACANYFRMAITTSRMSQNQSESIYFFPNFSGGGESIPPDPPSGGVLKHALRVNTKLWSFPLPPPPPQNSKSCMNPCM